jgi:hypothetical protein
VLLKMVCGMRDLLFKLRTSAIVATRPGSQYVKGTPSCCTALVTTRASTKHHHPACAEHQAHNYNPEHSRVVLTHTSGTHPPWTRRGCLWTLGHSIMAAPAHAGTALTRSKGCASKYWCPRGEALSHAIPVHVSPDPGLDPVAHVSAPFCGSDVRRCSGKAVVSVSEGSCCNVAD